MKTTTDTAEKLIVWPYTLRLNMTAPKSNGMDKLHRLETTRPQIIRKIAPRKPRHATQ